MATYSIYNIQIENNLSFLPGITAGSILSMNSNGSTSWIPNPISNMTETISFQDISSSISANTYTIDLYASYTYSVSQIRLQSSSGTCLASLLIGTTSISGMSGITVSSSIATATATAGGTVSVGNKLSLVTTSNSSLNNLQGTIKIIRI